MAVNFGYLGSISFSSISYLSLLILIIETSFSPMPASLLAVGSETRSSSSVGELLLYTPVIFTMATEDSKAPMSVSSSPIFT